jgi:hypothetical protein
MYEKLYKKTKKDIKLGTLVPLPPNYHDEDERINIMLQKKIPYYEYNRETWIQDECFMVCNLLDYTFHNSVLQITYKNHIYIYDKTSFSWCCGNGGDTFILRKEATTNKN